MNYQMNYLVNNESDYKFFVGYKLGRKYSSMNSSPKLTNINRKQVTYSVIDEYMLYMFYEIYTYK